MKRNYCERDLTAADEVAHIYPVVALNIIERLLIFIILQELHELEA